MDIPVDLYGKALLVWLVLALPTIWLLAERKTDTRTLTTVWGGIAQFFPPLGILFILALLLKNDR